MAVPFFAPRPILTWETGSILMENRLSEMKLMIAYHLRSLDETTLARQILNEQYKMEWPGLATEVKELCQQLNITDIVGKTRLNQKRTVGKSGLRRKCRIKITYKRSGNVIITLLHRYPSTHIVVSCL